MVSGYGAPTILAIVVYVLAVCSMIFNAVVLPHKVLQVVALLIFVIFAWLLCYGLHTLCANGHEGWAWGVLGIKVLGGFSAGLYMFAHSCLLSKSYSQQCQLLNAHK